MLTIYSFHHALVYTESYSHSNQIDVVVSGYLIVRCARKWLKKTTQQHFTQYNA